MKRLSPVILVDEVEPCINFWLDLGFENAAEVQEGDRLGFVMLKSGSVEVMYQSRASVANEVPALAEGSLEKSGIALFIEVEDLDAIKPMLEQQPVVVPERKTFYGMREIGIRAPCGTAVTFAQAVDE